MNERRFRSIVVFIVFLCALVAGGSEGNRRLPSFSRHGIPLYALEIDEDTAEKVWMHCKSELEESAVAFEDFNLYLLQHNEAEVQLFPKRSIHRYIIRLPLQVKQSLLDCLRKKDVISHDSNKEAFSWTWLQEVLSNLYTLPRRYLLKSKPPRISISVSPAPAPAGGPAGESPTHSEAPADQVPVSSPDPSSDPPSIAPVKPLPSSPPKDPVHSPPAPRAVPPAPRVVPPPPPRVVPPPPPPRRSPPPPKSPPPDNNENKNLTIIAIAAVSVAGLALLALVLVCFLRGRKKVEPGDGQKDEKPFLNISSSNISGSSQASHNEGNSSNKIFGTSSIVNNISVGTATINLSSAEAQVLAATGDGNSALPLPPGKSAPPPPGPPPPPPPKPPAPAPPPPPKMARPPPNPPKPNNLKKPSPLGPHQRGHSTSGDGNDQFGDPGCQKTKLKPFFWDKVAANPDHSMVWNEIKAGSFQFNEEMMESLFGYAPTEKNTNERAKPSSSFENQPQYIQIIDPRKAQNLSILLRALNVTTEEVCDSLKEGNELPVELIQTLLKMAPTTEEELKLRLYNGDLSQLGPAERFLKIMVDIPFAFKRLESLLFMSSLEEESAATKDSFATLEVASTKLRNSRLFLKLLEAVLKTGNRMNVGTYRGGAQAFKLDTLLKLSDVKGTDGKTTLLHFVVQEIVRTEGMRAARRLKESQSMSSVKTEDLNEDPHYETVEAHRNLGLQVVSGLREELEDVRKAALIDGDNLTSTVSKLGYSLKICKEFVNNEMKSIEADKEFCDSLSSFVEHAESDILFLLEEEKRIMALVKSTADYFHGQAGKDEGLRLFVIVRDFLIMVEKVCKEVGSSPTMAMRTPRKGVPTASSTFSQEPPLVSPSSQETPSTTPFQEPIKQSPVDMRERLFPAIKQRQMEDDFSSDDDS